MNTDLITNPLVKSAFNAFQAGNKKEWFSLFADDAQLFDDGNKMNLVSFFSEAVGHERFDKRGYR